MKLTELNEQVEKLPNKDRNAILAVIELKTENDMDKVLSKLDNIEKRLENKIDIQSNTLRWAIGVGFALIGLLITILKFLG